MNRINPSNHRNGVLVVMLAILLPVMIIILGFAIDFANIQRVRNELRVAADLSSKAAADQLALTNDQAAARAAAMSVGYANSVAGQPLNFSSDQIVSVIGLNSLDRFSSSESSLKRLILCLPRKLFT